MIMLSLWSLDQQLAIFIGVKIAYWWKNCTFYTGSFWNKTTKKSLSLRKLQAHAMKNHTGKITSTVRDIASLAIMRTQLRSPFKALCTKVLKNVFGGVRVTLNLAPTMPGDGGGTETLGAMSVDLQALEEKLFLCGFFLRFDGSASTLKKL